MMLRRSPDGTRLLLEDGKVFAVKGEGAENFTFAHAMHAAHDSDADLLDGKKCIRIKYCSDTDAKGKCVGWSVELVCEI